MQTDVSKPPAWSLSPACPGWEVLLFGEDAPSTTQLQHQFSFCVSLQGIKNGHREEAARRWRRAGPVPCLHLLL